MNCRICGNHEGNERFVAKEMMFGLREEFAYFQCRACDCLQIETIPTDLSRYYPDDYYSKTAPIATSRGVTVDALRRASSWLRLHTANPGGTKRSEVFSWLRGARATYRSRVLDVGCGRGRLLHDLHLDGFRDLTGVDPFLDHDLHSDNGITIHRAQLGDIDGRFDLVMMHHSFEHMPDPHAVLRSAAERLTPTGCLLIRIPLASSHAWRHYGVDWFQLDAPRHFYLHGRKSLQLLADQTGFGIDRVIYDSKASQFWGSEQYARDIPHRSERSHAEDPTRSIFSPRKIREFSRRSRALNRSEDGDAACFFLRPR